MKIQSIWEEEQILFCRFIFIHVIMAAKVVDDEPSALNQGYYWKIIARFT